MRKPSSIPKIINQLRQLDAEDLSILANVMLDSIPDEAEKLRLYLVFADMDRNLREVNV